MAEMDQSETEFQLGQPLNWRPDERDYAFLTENFGFQHSESGIEAVPRVEEARFRIDADGNDVKNGKSGNREHSYTFFDPWF